MYCSDCCCYLVNNYVLSIIFQVFTNIVKLDKHLMFYAQSYEIFLYLLVEENNLNKQTKYVTSLALLIIFSSRKFTYISYFSIIFHFKYSFHFHKRKESKSKIPNTLFLIFAYIYNTKHWCKIQESKSHIKYQFQGYINLLNFH